MRRLQLADREQGNARRITTAPQRCGVNTTLHPAADEPQLAKAPSQGHNDNVNITDTTQREAPPACRRKASSGAKDYRDGYRGTSRVLGQRIRRQTCIFRRVCRPCFAHGDIRRINLPAMEHKDVHSLVYDIMSDAQRKVFKEKPRGGLFVRDSQPGALPCQCVQPGPRRRGSVPYHSVAC